MPSVRGDIERWLDEVVTGLNLCPFAAKPYHNDQVKLVVSKASTPEKLLADLQDEITCLNQSPTAEIETTLLIIPEMLVDFNEYNQFLDLVDILLTEFEWEGIFQVASFHPDYCFADTQPEAVENLTNRSPYPILHIIREESIESALENITSPDEVYKRNIQTMNSLSPDKIVALFPYLNK